MNNYPSIAILLTAYNGMSWIRQQIESILEQKNVTLDIYISIDISKDQTHQWCEALSKENKNIIVLPYGEKFGNATKNFFRLIKDVDFNKYDYISLADQDDVWNSNKLQRAIALLCEEEFDGYSSNVTAFWENNKKVFIKKSFPQKKYDFYFESAGPGCTYVLKKESLQKFKDFLINNWSKVNQIQSHDWLIYAYFRSKSMKWIIDDKALTYYRQHEYNEMGASLGIRAYKKRFSLFKSKKYRDEVQKIINLLRVFNRDEFSLMTLFLLRNINHLRRRPRDVLILFFMIALRIF